MPLTTPNREDDPKQLTEEQKEQKERTNQIGDRDSETAGNIVGVRFDLTAPVPGIVANIATPFNVDDVPYALIATSDGIQQVRLRGFSAQQLARLIVGGWTEFKGEKVHEQLFDATDIR